MCAFCDWEAYLYDMQDAMRKGLDSDFIESVADFCETRKHITERQKEGVNNWLRRFKKSDRYCVES